MPRKPTARPEGALYVRLPADAVERIDRAAGALRVPKKDLIAGLVAKYVDPDSRRGLSALGSLAQPRRVVLESDGKPTPGFHSFRPYDAPEVLTPAQAAELLQVDEKLVIKLAEDGTLPGKKLGSAFRFTRSALLAWLSTRDEG